MLHVILLLAILWILVCFLDVIFKTCMLCPYIKSQDALGITVKPFYLHCYITRYNRILRKLGHHNPAFLCKWFNAGAFFSCCFIIPSFGVLLASALKVISIEERVDLDSTILVPVVPGVNLPLSHLLYYFVILILCSIVHELGHAVAASRENVPIQGCGFFILLILPAAFVDLHREHLMHLSPWQQMRIYCAGIWHNVVLALFALLLLLSNPIILKPFYMQGSGITVVDVLQNSGASGPAGLNTGDQILSVNNCAIHSTDSWMLCLREVALNSQHGYCADKDFILKEDVAKLHEPGKDCCGNSSSHICLDYSDAQVDKEVCLPARQLIKNATVCHKNTDCGNVNVYSCLMPVLLSDAERFIEIKRHSKLPVLFYGSMAELYASVTVTSWISIFRFAPVNLIVIYETLLKYLFSFSSALALLNLIPCPGLDGQFLCETLVHVLMFQILPKVSHRNLVILILKSFGCLLICINIVVGVYKLNFSL